MATLRIAGGRLDAAAAQAGLTSRERLAGRLREPRRTGATDPSSSSSSSLSSSISFLAAAAILAAPETVRWLHNAIARHALLHRPRKTEYLICPGNIPV